MTREELLVKLKYYEQAYFTNDEPVPFVGDLQIYPALVKDYYKFYSLVPCFTMNKNEDPEGIIYSHLGYVFKKIKEDESGFFGRQFVQLLSLVFRVDNKLVCPNCGETFNEEKYRERIKKFEELEKKIPKEERNQQNPKYQEFLQSFSLFLEEAHTCSCGSYYRYPIRIEGEEGKEKLFVNDTEITSKDYEELRTVYCYQNIIDYDDEYIDPELKAALEETARLKNPNAVQPTLEKQMSCILTNSPYTYETLRQIPIRKMVMLLRVIDAKIHYMAYRQGEMSGMVKFSKELDHWIYSNDKKDKFADIMTVDQLKEKLKDVT